MTTIEVNGRKYNVKDFMTWAEAQEYEESEHPGVRLLFENLINDDGNKYESAEAMQAAIPCPDVRKLKQAIYTLNGLGDIDPLAEQSDSSGD